MLTSEESIIYFKMWGYSNNRMEQLLKELCPCLRQQLSVGIDSMGCIKHLVHGDEREEVKDQLREVIYQYLKVQYPEWLMECLLLDKM